jgi:glutathione synthase
MPVLKIGVVMDPIEKINIDKDTTFVLLLEAEQRNHEVYYMELDDLFIRGGIPTGVRVEFMSLAGHLIIDWGIQNRCSRRLDVVLMRKDPPFDMKFSFLLTCSVLVNEKNVL